jgi:hypothetical protein
VFGPRHPLGVRHLDGHEPLQLLVVGQVDQAEAALTQEPLDAVAADVRGCGRGRNGRAWFRRRHRRGHGINGRAWFPSALDGLVRIVHRSSPLAGGSIAPTFVTADSDAQNNPNALLCSASFFEATSTPRSSISQLFLWILFHR